MEDLQELSNWRSTPLHDGIPINGWVEDRGKIDDNYPVLSISTAKPNYYHLPYRCIPGASAARYITASLKEERKIV